MNFSGKKTPEREKPHASFDSSFFRAQNFFRIYAVFLQFISEILSCYGRRSCGGGKGIIFFEGGKNEFLFKVPHLFVKRTGVIIRRQLWRELDIMFYSRFDIRRYVVLSQKTVSVHVADHIKASLNYIFQFAHVARPGITAEQLKSISGDTEHIAVHSPVEMPDEVISQQGNIAAAGMHRRMASLHRGF